MKKKSWGETKPKTKKVQFNLLAPEAERVFLAGEFNNWGVDSLPMKQDKRGTWYTSLALSPEDMSTVSALMGSGMTIQMRKKWLKIPLEATIVLNL